MQNPPQINPGNSFPQGMQGQNPQNPQPQVPAANGTQTTHINQPPTDLTKQWWESIKKSETFAKKINRSFRTVYDLLANENSFSSESNSSHERLAYLETILKDQGFNSAMSNLL